MEVKLVARTLDVFEIFAREGRALSLTELSRLLDAAPSSTLALVRTLLIKGYLYEPARRGSYYPTKKIVVASGRIDDADPVLECFHPHLAALRDATGETVVLGQRSGSSVVYLDVVPSPRAIRYMVEPGETRLIQANSIGRALFAMMPVAEQRILVGKGEGGSASKYWLDRAARDAQRGWAENVGDSVPDLAAIAIGLQVAGGCYGVSVVGPMARMQAVWSQQIEHLQSAGEQLRRAFALL